MMPTPENIGQHKLCKICEIDRDTTSHIISCIFLKCQVPEALTIDGDSMKNIYENDLSKTIEFLKIFEKMWRKREELLEKMKTSASEEELDL